MHKLNTLSNDTNSTENTATAEGAQNTQTVSECGDNVVVAPEAEQQTDTVQADAADSNDAAPKQSDESAPEWQFHELAELFPRLSDEEMEDLGADIEKNGLVEPVTMYQGKVLDGRNRVTACLKRGIEIETVEYDGDTPLAFVISKNARRRHLSVSQRAILADKLANMKPGERKNAKQANLPISEGVETKEVASQVAAVSQDEAAKMMGVSPRLVRHVAKLRREAPELIEQVELGKMTINAALSKLPRNKRTRGKSDRSQADAKNECAPTAEPEVEPTDIKDQAETGPEDAENAQQIKGEGDKANAPSENKISPDALVAELKQALALQVDSPERSDAITKAITALIRDCFPKDTVRQEFLKGLQAELVGPEL